MKVAARSAGSLFDRSNTRLDYRQLFVVLALFAFVQMTAVLNGISPIADERYIGTDTYARMVRVQDLLERGDWFDSRYERVNPPAGLVSHWTRPLDALIVAGFALLTPFLDDTDALYWSGAAVSPFLQLLGIFVVYFGTRGIFGRDWAFFCSLLFIVQPVVTQSFVLGRPDHNALQLLLTTLSIILTLHLLYHPFNRRLCYAAGSTYVLALWTSVETLLPIFACLFGLGLAWLIWRRDLAKMNLHLAAGTATAALVALYLERGGAGFVEQQMQLDRYSLFYALLFVLLAAFWAILHIWDLRAGAGQTAVARGLAAALGSAIAVAALWAINPTFFSGSWFPIDPLYFNTRSIYIKESLPIVSWELYDQSGFWTWINRFLFWFGFIIPGSIYLAFLLTNWKSRDFMLWLLLALAVAILLGYATATRTISYRHIPAVALIMVFPYTELVSQTYLRLAGLKSLMGEVTRSAALLGLSLWPMMFSGHQVSAPFNGSNLGGASICPESSLIRFLGSNAPWRDAPMKVMAYADLGPEIMFRTRHIVFSIPNHRPQPGYTDTFRALTADNDTMAREILARQQVDLIVFCRTGAIAQYFHRDAYGVNAETPVLSERLLQGDIPAWLALVDLPADLANSYLVLAVQKDESQ